MWGEFLCNMQTKSGCEKAAAASVWFAYLVAGGGSSARARAEPAWDNVFAILPSSKGSLSLWMPRSRRTSAQLNARDASAPQLLMSGGLQHWSSSKSLLRCAPTKKGPAPVVHNPVSVGLMTRQWQVQPAMGCKVGLKEERRQGIQWARIT